MVSTTPLLGSADGVRRLVKLSGYIAYNYLIFYVVLYYRRGSFNLHSGGQKGGKESRERSAARHLGIGRKCACARMIRVGGQAK